MIEGAHKRVAVVGGGITGLASAFRLQELAAAGETPLRVTVFERADRVGGALDTVRRDGFVIEGGADSFLSEKTSVSGLAARLGIESELINTNPQFRKTRVVHDGSLVEIPDGFSLLAPGRLLPVWTSPLFSLRGKLRIAIEPLIPRRRETRDESLGSFVRRRMGAEVLDRIAQALAGGIYTADPETLSLDATMPRFAEMERAYGSVIRGLKAANRNRPEQAAGTSGARWSLFLSFRGGVGALVEAIAARLGECLRPRTEVVEISRADRAGWNLRLSNRSTIEADAVVVAAPAHAAAPMLNQCDARLAAALREIRYASAATVNLAYRLADFPSHPDSFGFVVPAKEHRKIIACSFSSLKFAGRAPQGVLLLRVFLGGALNDRMMRLDDGAMAAAAREEMLALLGIRAEPLLTLIRRWPDSMPQYTVGHLDRIASIERRVTELPGLALAGAAYRGVGIPDCIRSGEQAGDAIMTHLRAAL